MTALILLLVFFSGFTGLIYQVVWQKYLSAYLGSHALATSQVLACFFLFMAIGYFVIGRYQHKLVKNKVFLYGIIEGVIGVYALISPDFFFWLTGNFSFYSEGIFSELLCSLLLTGLFIGLPTFLMGGTIPVLTQGLVNKFQVSHRMHSWIYATNTFGAFAGTLMGGFYFIENHGLPMSLFIVGLLNVIIFVVCYIIWKAYPNEFLGLETKATEQPEEKEEVKVIRRHSWSLYVISFASGFYVFGLENIIIKLAGITLGSSTYTYSIIVSAFILAIAMGSSIVSLFKKIESANLLLRIQSVLLVSLVAIYFSIPHWPRILNRVDALVRPNLFNFNLKWYIVLCFFIFILIIPIGLMGTNLPLLFSYLKQRDQYLSKTVGRLYSINSIGGFLGALLGGYYILKIVPLDTAFKGYILLVALTLFFVSLLYKRSYLQKLLSLSAGILAVVLVFHFTATPWHPNTFTPGAFLYKPVKDQSESYSEWYREHRKKINNNSELLMSKSGPNTWAVVQKDIRTGSKTLYVNGKPDASTQGDHIVRAMNMLIPLSISPEIENIFVVGLGASLSTGIATKFSEVKKVDVAEISQGVIDSMPYFNKESFNILERKNKFNLYQVDAYRNLKSSKEKYNLIVSEPSNLWVSGVDLLFTIEFLKEAKNHLSKGGIYSQWFPLFNMDEKSFRMILANFNAVFPNVTLWATGPLTVNIIASEERIKISDETLNLRFNEQKKIYATYNINNFQSILGFQALPEGTTRGITSDVKSFHSIEWPRLEYFVNKSHFLGTVVNLNSFLKTKIIRPLPIRKKEFQFLYEDLQGPLAEAFYIENIKRAEDPNGTLRFMRRRLIYDYNKKFNSAKTKFNRQVIDNINYFLGGKGRANIDINKNLEASLQVFDIFKEAMAMHLPVKVDSILGLIPRECLGNLNCYVAKKYIVKQLFGSEVVDLNNIKKQDWKKIEKDYSDFARMWN